MKKYFLILSTLLFLFVHNSCSERDLDLFPPDKDEIDAVNTEAKLQQLLNGSYLTMASSNVFGTEVMLFGDLMGDKLFVSNSNSSYLNTYNFNYNGGQNDFGFYGSLYDAIMKCNIVINSTKVPASSNLTRIKGEAKILRAFAYFTLVNYYSPTPTSGINQEYGVPLVLDDYEVNIQPARATVAQVYDQIIKDLKDGAVQADASALNPATNASSKVRFTQTAAKLLLSRVYLTRRAPGDAELALQYATEIVNNSNASFAKIDALAPTIPKDLNNPDAPFDLTPKYVSYFSGAKEEFAEGQPETIWELDLNNNTNLVTGIGSNISLPCYYNRTDSRKCLLFNQAFYQSFPATDVRRGSPSTGLLTSLGVPVQDNPRGYWTNKYPRFTQEGNYFRNIKVLRFAEAQLNRIEALHLTGQNALALTELNAFAASRGGSTYTGTNLLNDILTEKAKEFYGEGQRFLDLKRYNLPVVKTSNCTVNCNIPANDKLFVLPIDQTVLNANANLTQYPGYN